MNTPVGSPLEGRGVSHSGRDGRREADPGYPRLMDRRELVEDGRGGMWVDFTDREQTYFVVRLDEWPALKSIRDAHLELIARRTQIVAGIIEAGYRREGSAFLRVPVGKRRRFITCASHSHRFSPAVSGS